MAAARNSDPGKRGRLGCQWGWASLFSCTGVCSPGWLWCCSPFMVQHHCLPAGAGALDPRPRCGEGMREGWGCPGDAVGFCVFHPAYLHCAVVPAYLHCALEVIYGLPLSAAGCVGGGITKPYRYRAHISVVNAELRLVGARTLSPAGPCWLLAAPHSAASLLTAVLPK